MIKKPRFYLNEDLERKVLRNSTVEILAKGEFRLKEHTMKLVLFCCTSFLLLLALVSSSAQTRGLYDNFQANFIDPSKWVGASICVDATTLECVREVQDSSLRLAIRTYGGRDSNAGIQFDTSFLNFKNPSLITSFGSSILIPNAEVAACAGNTEPSHAQLLLSGSFFNTGTGNVQDDVQAFLVIEQHSNFPIGVIANAFLHTAGQFFGGVSLGMVELDEQVFASLQWDQPNHRFVFSLIQQGAPRTVVSAYSLSDTTPPSAPSKFLGIRNFVPNCVDASTVAYMEARFSNVLINMPLP